MTNGDVETEQGWEKTQFFEKTRDPRVFSKNMGFSLGFFKARVFSKYEYSTTIYRPPGLITNLKYVSYIVFE